ncbi:MAG: hypothetical protein ACE5GE_02355 [Phycisphaerae bacterium]
MTDDQVQPCQGCGASIYPEHVETGIAGYHGGQLLCPHCLKEKQGGGDAGGKEVDLSPVVMDASESPGGTTIRSYSGDSLAGASHGASGESKYQHPPNPDSPYASRCRTFHTKLNEGAVSFMQDQINSWADQDPNIRIKFASSAIGIFEGKHADPHLILTVFY